MSRPLQVARTLRFVLGHPLNRRAPGRALARWLGWQIGSRLLPGAVSVPFVGDTRLLVEPGMTGATGNVYTGLHELEPMAFVLHALRPGDLFVDVGANVGSYTVLASGAAGARVVAYEPVPATFAHLRRNVQINALEDRVRVCNVGVGARPDRLTFSSGEDTMNHVLAHGLGESGAILVDVKRLDDDPNLRDAILLKIDVEGYEGAVLEGAIQLLSSPSVQAIVIELIGQGSRYGFDEDQLRRTLRAEGFREHEYDPFSRRLTPAAARSQTELFVRDATFIAERLRTAPRWKVLDTTI